MENKLHICVLAVNLFFLLLLPHIRRFSEKVFLLSSLARSSSESDIEAGVNWLGLDQIIRSFAKIKKEKAASCERARRVNIPRLRYTKLSPLPRIFADFFQHFFPSSRRRRAEMSNEKSVSSFCESSKGFSGRVERWKICQT